MSMAVGTVSSITGVVQAIDPSTGAVRLLSAGDQVFENEMLVTSPTSSVAVALDNGEVLSLGRGSEMVVDSDVIGLADATDPETENAIDVETLQQAILEGEVDLDELEATAAGEAGSSSSSISGPLNTVDRLGSEGEVSSGFESSTVTASNDIERNFIDLAATGETDTQIATPSISLEAADANEDGVYNAAELGEDGTVNATISVAGSEEGDTLSYSVNGGTEQTVTLTASDIADGVTVAINPEDTITAQLSDEAGNTSDEASATALPADLSAEPGTVTVDNITEDDVINAQESGETITVSGGATGGDISEGDAVTMTINGEAYETTVGADGSWSVDVAGRDLAADTEFDVTVTSSDTAGNTVESTGSSSHTVNQAPVAEAQTGSVEEDATISGQMSASDVDLPAGASLTFSTDSTAEGLTFNNDGSYSFDASSYDNLSEGETQEIEVPVTVTDDQGATDETTLTITVTGTNDAPVANVESVTLNEDANAVIDVTSNDTDLDGTIDPTTVTITTQPEHGTVSVNATTGEVTYTPEGNYNGEDSFEYTVQDDDGATSNPATVSLTVTDVNDAPVVQNTSASATVSEEGLPGGLADDVGTLDSTDSLVYDSSVQGGSMNFSDVEGDALEVTGISFNGTGLTSGGEPVTWNGVDNSDGSYILTGQANGEDVLQLNVDNTGDYSVELLGPIDHSDTTTEDVEQLGFTVTVNDGTASSDATLTVNVEDDSPVNGDVVHDIEVPESNTNIMLVMDYSGSMRGQELTDMKAVLIDMLEAYQETGNVAVQLVSYSDGADTLNDGGWVTVDEAISTIGALTDSDMGGGTYYDEALNEAQSAFNESEGKLTASNVQNVSYFLSDGAPTNGHEIDSEQSGWETFLKAEDIDSYAVGFGGASTTDLEPIAYNGVEEVERSALDGSQSNLTEVLVDTVAEPVTGSLLGNMSGQGFGADGGHILSITVDGSTYSYDPQSGGSITGGSVNNSGHVLTVTTSNNGELSLNFETGDYAYVAPSEFTAGSAIQESLDYTAVDGDGDQAGGNITLNVSKATDSVNEVVLTGQDSGMAGLYSEYYAYNQGSDGQNLTSLAQIDAFMSANNPDATFIAEDVFYSYGNGDLADDNDSSDSLTNLEAFLGNDAASLSVDDPALGTDAILHMQGTISLAAGDYNFHVRADDGYAIKIDGKTVAEADYIQSPTGTSHDTFTITESGNHFIEIVYWDQGGEYVFEPTLSSGSGVTYQPLSGFDLGYEAATGNVMNNIDFGDGVTTSLSSVSYNGQVYNASDYPSGEAVILGDHGTLKFDFNSGDYTYIAAGAAMDDFTISASGSDGDTTEFNLKVTTAGEAPVEIVNETFDSDSEGWQKSNNLNSQANQDADTEDNQLFIDRDEYVEKTYSLEPGETVQVSFDMATQDRWEGESSYYADYFRVVANGDEVLKQYDDYNGQISFEAQADSNGDLTLQFEVNSTANSEEVRIDNLTISRDETIDSILYGDDDVMEQFAIHSDTEIQDFDIEHDTLDLSEVIHDGFDSNTDDLNQYLNLIDNNDGTSTVEIDSDGDGSTSDDKTQVVVDTSIDSNDSLNVQIDDQNIDYQEQ